MATSGEVTRDEIDFEGLIQRWALDAYTLDMTRKQRKLLQKNRKSNCLSQEVDWSRVDVEHGKPDYDIRPFEEVVPRANVIYEAAFSNRTSDEQSSSFETQRTTRSSCTVTQEQSYTFSKEFSCTLKLPNEIFEAGASFSSEMGLTNCKEETMEKEITWTVNTQINVKAKSRAIAKLVIEECENNGRYQFETSMCGTLRVVFYNLKDNNSFVCAVEGRIVDIVRSANLRSKNVRIQNNRVFIRHSGECVFRFGVKQEVEVYQEPLGDDVRKAPAARRVDVKPANSRP